MLLVYTIYKFLSFYAPLFMVFFLRIWERGWIFWEILSSSTIRLATVCNYFRNKLPQNIWFSVHFHSRGFISFRHFFRILLPSSPNHSQTIHQRNSTIFGEATQFLPYHREHTKFQDFWFWHVPLTIRLVPLASPINPSIYQSLFHSISHQ